MTRALNAIEESPAFPFVDRTALMLDEGHVYNDIIDDFLGAGTAGGGGGTAIGQTLYNTDGTLAGRLIEGGPGKFYLTTGSGTTQKFNPFKGGTYLVDAGAGDVFQVMLDPQGGITKSATATLPTGGAAPSYASTQPAQQAQFAQDQTMANLNAQLAEAQAARDYERSAALQREILAEQQKFQAEQNRLAEEAMLKRERLGVLQNLVEGFLQSQQRASEFVLQMQPDWLRFAAAAQGMPVFGTTPQEGYAGALTEYAQRPAPTMDPNAPLSAIEQGIQSMTGQQMPLAPGMFGMGTGGTVPMGASGTFLVGEKGPEVMEVSPSGVTVKPLQGGFQYGGGVDFDINTILQGLAPLYTNLGLDWQQGRVPRGRVESGYGIVPTGAFRGFRHPETFERMGIKPQFIRFAGDTPTTGSAIFMRDPETGEMRHLPPGMMPRMGGRYEDIMTFDPSARDYFKYGPAMTSPLQPTIPGEISPFGPMGVPAIDPLSGAILPAPYKIAAERRRMASVNPELYEGTKYPYNYPNSPVPWGALKTAEDIFTPRGTQRYPIGLR